MAIVGLVGAIVAAILVQESQDIRRKAGAGPAVLSVNPSSQDRNVDELSSINISLNPNGAEVASVELVIDYDSSIIEVTDIVTGEFFTSAVAIVGDPVETIKDLATPGRIHYAVGFPSGHTSTEVGNAAVISFRGAAQGVSPITFVVSGDPQT